MATDFGKMRKYEKACESGDYKYEEMEETKTESNDTGRVKDLILPIVFLIGASILSMLYTGGLFKGGVSVASAFANCDAITGLAMGAAYTVLFLAILYLPRKIVTPKQYLDGLVKGFINMVPASLILTFAWTLSGVCGADYLNAGGFVAHIVETYHMNLHFMPAVFFVVALLLAFSTGTSWETFAIMLPITTAVFGDQMTSLTVITTAAVLGGSVCGDHVSPISDTTILSSTGAQCNHLNHVSSQLQYGAVAALMTLFCYLVTGWINSASLGLAIGIISLFAFVVLVKRHYGD